MSERNGDRARFQKDRQRKLRKRQRIQDFLLTIRVRQPAGGRIPVPADELQK